uniref:Uncharacterized protein n=1 Tax=Arundo donax TaxID=35708 RepID=A0A0A9CAJ2_ARUDO
MPDNGIIYMDAKIIKQMLIVSRHSTHDLTCVCGFG